MQPFRRRSLALPVLFLFLDGVGVGPRDRERNPFARARLPHWEGLAGSEVPFLGGAGRGWRPVDATLGVEGLPQSGTGQVTLLAGVNAARYRQRHVGPWIDPPLKELLSQRNAFAAVLRAGKGARLANAFPDQYLDRVARGRGRSSAIVWAARLAGLPLLGHRELRRGEALSAFLDQDGWRRMGYDVPRITPEEAGRRLARLARQGDFTLFEYYLSDFLGHRQDMSGAVAALEAFDAFLGGILAALDREALLVLSSDHGNLEELHHSRHTRNPVPLMASGRGAEEVLGSVDRLDELMPAVLKQVNVDFPVG